LVCGRAAFVLARGFQLLECSVPSQVLSEPDGRIRVSFMNQAPGPAALVIKPNPARRPATRRSRAP
jgi:hypothetical protein